MKKLLLLLFLTSCASPSLNYNKDNETLNFDNDLSFKEFNDLLIEYAKKNPYPNID
tara:strand:+ start:70 stop:237 length:168 start_codon:yes stop_codon:yes gene_type:complete